MADVDDQPGEVGLVVGQADNAEIGQRHDLGGVGVVLDVRDDRRRQVGEALGNDRLQQLLLGAEVVVERPERDIGLFGDLLNTQASNAFCGDQGAAGVQQLPPRAQPLPLGARWRRTRQARLHAAILSR
jgi:hypothetical protein